MQYLDEVTNKLSGLLSELPKDERENEMAECESRANGYLNSNPRHDNPALFSLDLLSALRPLVEKDKNRLAMSAESPSELVSNLMPSDGHLD